MTSFAELLRPDRGEPAIALHLVDKSKVEEWIAGLPERQRVMAAAAGFRAEPNQMLILPEDRPANWSAAIGMANADTPGPWCLARAAEALPAATYRIVGAAPGKAALGWLLAQHRFEQYKTRSAGTERKAARILLTPDASTIDRHVALAHATALVRDLLATPAGALGPAELEQAVWSEASRWGGVVSIVAGRALAEGFPLIHAVGAAAAPGREPRLVQVEWGKADDPRVAIVGKGVCFDSGGLDIKSAAGMRLMKKDMGGAAHALALAGLVAEARLPVRLQLLIPAVENAIAGAALRPGDVVRSRQGLHVEIHNTDAEGRLVLADAISLAAEASPELLIDFATLTGAARVALGPDLPALFANDETLAADFLAAAGEVADPVWRLPLWQGYDELLSSEVADIANASESAFAGAVTAALFLKRFVPDALPWAHLDTFAWRPAAKPGRPKGGDALSLRAAFELLARRYPDHRS